MKDKKFVIKDIAELRFFNLDGGPAQDIRDKKPVEKKFNKDKSIKELLMESTIPLIWMSDDFFKKLGHDASRPLCDMWNWEEDKIDKVDEKDLWKAYGLISGYWLSFYEFLYEKEVYEFRKYRREQGEDLDTVKIKPSNIDIGVDSSLFEGEDK